MNSNDTLLITHSQVASLLTIEECIAAVEHAFKLHATGLAQAPGVLGTHAHDGGFHTKAGILDLGTKYFVSKTNANFPGNRKKYWLPTIQGIVMVSNAENGRLLALIDSVEITIIRTGAATAIAAKYLSRTDSKTATIIGCGNQGKISLEALMVIRKLNTVYAYDIDPLQAKTFSEQLSSKFQINIVAVNDFRNAVLESDICVTCTTSKEYFLKPNHVRPGTFIAAVGSDSEDKHELDPLIISKNKVVCDLSEQCVKIGEVHHAIEQGVFSTDQIHAELGQVIAGLKPGREREEEIVIFDSTGTALQDVAASVIVYEKALKKDMGLRINFAK